MRFGICGLLILALVVPQAGCRRLRKAREEAEKAEEREAARDAERYYERLLAGQDEDGDRAMEARKYLAPNQSKNSLGSINRDHAVKWVEDLYQDGAVKVHAVYTPGEGPRLNKLFAFLVELPQTPAQRMKLLATFNRIRSELDEGGAPEPDNGQRFVYLGLED